MGRAVMVYSLRRMALSQEGLGGTSHSREGACVHLPAPQRLWLRLRSTEPAFPSTATTSRRKLTGGAAPGALACVGPAAAREGLVSAMTRARGNRNSTRAGIA